MRGHKYTEIEEQFLVENSDMSIFELANRLNRSYHSVAIKLSKLKIGKCHKHDQDFVQKIRDCKTAEDCIQISKSFDLKIGTVMVYFYQYNKKSIRIYTIWRSIIKRCLSKKCKNYENYGGRNISICNEWAVSFETFLKWSMSNGYNNNLSIDRIDNDGNYCPENCRWVTARIQANNRRNTIYLTAFGETKTLAEWSRDDRCTVEYAALIYRFHSGKFTPEEIITKPKKGQKA